MKKATYTNAARCSLVFAVMLLAVSTAFAESSQAAKNEALFKAAKSGTAADIRAAIKAGADVNARDGILAMTPLMYAA